jgi:hypothetical protein
MLRSSQPSVWKASEHPSCLLEREQALLPECLLLFGKEQSGGTSVQPSPSGPAVAFHLATLPGTQRVCPFTPVSLPQRVMPGVLARALDGEF